MVTGQSIINDNNQNNTINETADQDETTMEVDGQAVNTNMELNKTLDLSVGEENDVNVTIENIREYFRATNTADDGDAEDTVDAVIIFDILETAEQSDFVSFVIGLASRHLSTNDFDESSHNQDEDAHERHAL